MGYKVGSIAIALLTLAAVLLAANFCYGLIHETAHAVIVKALGGEVFQIYVNPAGLDACIEHSPIAGPGVVMVGLAGLCATTLSAMIMAIAGKEIIPAFFALRTMIYALNYAPGTDISNLYASTGDFTYVLSIVLAIGNLLALSLALRGRIAPITNLSASLLRGLPRHNSGE
ncbi:hypothetical protein [Methanocella sp. MCL-LM]|uniref:hypothetical protein n=1 Tax=Methanocella sp. MCL-LM TaxID=3412035 RepID=UPI003C73E0A1